MMAERKGYDHMILSDVKKESKKVSAVGIVAEYNPFHNGHAYQISKAKQLSGTDYCIVVMSGDFVQRGAPAVFDKYTRTEMALSSGADLVVEIPPAFAVSSAEDFAACAVALLDRMQVVSHLCFGSECGETAALLETAGLLYQESEDFRRFLKEGLKNGLTFPQARIKALECLARSGSCDSSVLSAEKLPSLLSAPNNILAVEYCKALMRRNSPMIPITLKRAGADYHDTRLPSSPSCEPPASRQKEDTVPRLFCSASALREALKNSSVPQSQSAEPYVPGPVWELMKNSCPIFPDDFSSLMSFRLLELLKENEDPTQFGDVSAELAARIRRQSLNFTSLEDRIRTLKTRQYTYTRVSRSLIHILLSITKEDLAVRKSHDYVSYFRILGFRKRAVPLLSEIKRTARLPLITKTANAVHVLDKDIFSEFTGDLFCSHIYQAVSCQKTGALKGNEYTHPLVLPDLT